MKFTKNNCCLKFIDLFNVAHRFPYGPYQLDSRHNDHIDMLHKIKSITEWFPILGLLEAVSCTG